MNEQEVLEESTYDEASSTWTHSCGAEILAVTVHHSVHTMPHALAGNGEVKTRTVPFCPTCHDKPSAYGVSLKADMTDWPNHVIRRKATSTTYEEVG